MPDTPQRRPTDVAPSASTPADPTISAAEAQRAQSSTAGVTGSSMDKERMKRQASHWADQAKQRGRSMLDQQKGGAADQIAKLADVLHQTADQCSKNEDQRSIGRILDQAASGLERAADAIRSKDIDSLMNQATDLMRRQPALFIGGSVLAGFALSRFLKSSSQHGYSDTGSYGRGDRHRGDYDTSATGIYGEAYEETQGAEDMRRTRSDQELGGSGQSSFVTSAHVNPGEVSGSGRPGGVPPVMPTGRRDY